MHTASTSLWVSQLLGGAVHDKRNDRLELLRDVKVLGLPFMAVWAVD